MTVIFRMRSLNENVPQEHTLLMPSRNYCKKYKESSAIIAV